MWGCDELDFSIFHAMACLLNQLLRCTFFFSAHRGEKHPLHPLAALLVEVSRNMKAHCYQIPGKRSIIERKHYSLNSRFRCFAWVWARFQVQIIGWRSQRTRFICPVSDNLPQLPWRDFSPFQFPVNCSLCYANLAFPPFACEPLCTHSTGASICAGRLD